jgi:hypothetical protein
MPSSVRTNATGGSGTFYGGPGMEKRREKKKEERSDIS